MIARRRRDHAPPFGGAEVPNQIQAAADLERARRVVVLVFHVDIDPGLGLEQRVLEQRRRAQRAIHDPARRKDIVEREVGSHITVPSASSGAESAQHDTGRAR